MFSTLFVFVRERLWDIDHTGCQCMNATLSCTRPSLWNCVKGHVSVRPIPSLCVPLLLVILCNLWLYFANEMPLNINVSTSVQRPLVQMDEAREQQITNLLNSVKSEPPGASRDGCDLRATTSNSWRATPSGGANSHWWGPLALHISPCELDMPFGVVSLLWQVKYTISSFYVKCNVPLSCLSFICGHNLQLLWWGRRRRGIECWREIRGTSGGHRRQWEIESSSIKPVTNWVTRAHKTYWLHVAVDCNHRSVGLISVFLYENVWPLGCCS